MISEGEGIKQYIKEIAFSGTNMYAQLCYVTEVDEAKLTCTVRTADLKSIYNNVRLKEITKTDAKEQGVWMLPEKDSRVVVDLQDFQQPFIVMMSEVSKIVVNIDDKNKVDLSKEEGLKVEINPENPISVTVDKTLLAMDNKGFEMSTKNESLKTLLEDLIQAITQLTVSTAMGPSGTPINVADFTNIKTRVGKLLTK